jgi:hypothetical protein
MPASLLPSNGSVLEQRRVMKKVLVLVVAMGIAGGAMFASSANASGTYIGYLSGYLTHVSGGSWEYNGVFYEDAHQHRTDYVACYGGQIQEQRRHRNVDVFDPTWGAPYLTAIESGWILGYTSFCFYP